jgi:UDP-N-acetylglucosamine transferase subunit ALG13
LLAGTDTHSFGRLVEWADGWAREHPQDHVLVQYGSSSAPSTATGAAFLTADDLARKVTEADIVITHGGPGTITGAHQGGHRPLVVPRDPAHGEHVDDHQVRFARWAEKRGLATRVLEVDDLVGAIDALGPVGTRDAAAAAAGFDRADTVAAVQRLAESRSARRAPAPGAPVVLYVGGSGRSGSTLLECLVARLPGVVALGEVAHLWERGLRDNELCACEQPFHDCSFWTAVGKEAFGGWHHIDPEQVLSLKDAVDRQRRLPQTGRRHPGPELRRKILDYAGYYRRLFTAARDVAGADVVVDSSKVAPTALAYSHDRHIDLRVMHIVRDARGVAYSWSKAVTRPETRSEELMPQLSAYDATALWLSHNTSIAALRYRDVPVTRMRYEDLVRDPGAVVRGAWHDLDLPGSGELPMVGPTTIELEPTHSVAGNPMRFSHGLTTLLPDTAWRGAMSPRDRRLVTALTLPHLVAYGYVGRRR